jgi:hypothetical protein
VDFIPETFKDVPLGTYDQTSCSPQAPSSEWSGVIIDTAQRVFPPKGAAPVVPVCGYYLVPVLDAMDGPPLTLHVTRVDTMKILTAEIVEEGENEPEEPPPPDAPVSSRESLKGVYTGGYFNIDAQRYLPHSLEPGRYEVVVSYAGHVSNRVAVEIAAPPENDASGNDQ